MFIGVFLMLYPLARHTDAGTCLPVPAESVTMCLRHGCVCLVTNGLWLSHLATYKFSDLHVLPREFRERNEKPSPWDFAKRCAQAISICCAYCSLQKTRAEARERGPTESLITANCA